MQGTAEKLLNIGIAFLGHIKGAQVQHYAQLAQDVYKVYELGPGQKTDLSAASIDGYIVRVSVERPAAS